MNRYRFQPRAEAGSDIVYDVKKSGAAPFLLVKGAPSGEARQQRQGGGYGRHGDLNEERRRP
jgi:hypothetical protein